ncbi:arginase family protein [Sporolactobacillus sp. STCC-11]|uniref:arginase family protein n=1 Tax=Sporolactobacillus caesalpiniae TaxID=3230362 RepID=UPI00339640BE
MSQVALYYVLTCSKIWRSWHYSMAIYNNESGKTIIGFFGVGYDNGSAFFSGSRAAPDAIRDFSKQIGFLNSAPNGLTLGYYDPIEHSQKLKGQIIRDYGNLSLTNNQLLNIDRIEKLSRFIYTCTNIKPIFIGGDHSITYTIVKGLINAYESLQIVQLDAHSDLGYTRWETVEHGSFMRELLKEEKIENIIQVGIRGPQNNNIKEGKVTYLSLNQLNNLKSIIREDIPTFITVDCDVFDPSIFPGVAYPIPNGLDYEKYKNIINCLPKQIVGIDFVEFCPNLDMSNLSVSTISYAILEILSVWEDRDGSIY